MNNSSFPLDGDFDPSLSSIGTSFAEIERKVMDLEPKVRELNRQFVALLGKCPTSETGNWAYLAKSEDGGDFYVAFESLSFDKVMPLVVRSGAIVEIVEDWDGAISCADSPAPDIGPSIVGEAARLAFVPTTHVRVVRPS